MIKPIRLATVQCGRSFLYYNKCFSRHPSDVQQPSRRSMTNNKDAVPLVLRIVALSVNIANRASSIIRDVMKSGDLGVVVKGKNDFQTKADRSAQRCIIASLYKHFPDVAVFGEEELDPREEAQQIDSSWLETSLSPQVLASTDILPAELKNVNPKDIVIWVDPLDGTAEYTHGLLDHVTVLIGIAVKGVAVAGVIGQPYYNYEAGPDAPMGRVVWGIVHLGVFGLTPKLAPEGETIVATTRSHSNTVVTSAVAACNPTKVLHVGGAGHKVLLLMEGQAHAYVFASPGCKKWDTAAPEAVLHAMGGKLTDMHGRRIRYEADVERRNLTGVLATALAERHDHYASIVPDAVKKELPIPSGGPTRSG